MGQSLHRDAGLSAGLRAELGKDSRATCSSGTARLGIQGFMSGGELLGPRRDQLQTQG